MMRIKFQDLKSFLLGYAHKTHFENLNLPPVESKSGYGTDKHLNYSNLKVGMRYKNKICLNKIQFQKRFFCWPNYSDIIMNLSFKPKSALVL